MVSSVSDRVLNVRYPGLVIASKRGTGDNLHNRRLAPYPKTAPNAITKVDYLINILKLLDAKDTTIEGIRSKHQKQPSNLRLRSTFKDRLSEVVCARGRRQKQSPRSKL